MVVLWWHHWSLYNSSNFAADISRSLFLRGCFECESGKSSGVRIPPTPAVTLYKIYVSNFEEAVAYYTTHYFIPCFENFRETIIRKLPSTDQLNRIIFI